MPPRRHNPTAQIEIRQRNEEAALRYAEVANEHTRLKLKGEWEVSSSKKMVSRELMHKIDTVQARNDDVLVARRQRLTELLLRERDEHEAMLANMAETDDRRRERLMQQARDLRKEREALRVEESNRRKEQLFRESSQTVRDAESRIKVLNVADQRRQQLEELQERRQREKEEEEFFNEQWIEQQKLQAERSQRDLEQIHNRSQQIQRDLAVQVQANQRRREEAKSMQAREDQDFFASVREEKRREQEKEAKRRQHRTELAAEMKAWNEKLREIKDEEYAKLRAEDKKNLDELLSAIAADEAAEADRKRKTREDAARHMKLVEEQMNEAAESETALDRLWQEENDKEWAKREARWKDEQDRREALLRNVFETRRTQIAEIRENEKTMAESKRREHNQMIAEIKNLTDLDAGDLAKKRNVARENQAYLQMQIDKRNDEKAQTLTQKRFDMTDAQREEQQYQEMIQRELGKLEAAKPNQYRHVKLASQKRGISGM